MNCRGGPGGPLRCPPVEALNFADDSKTSFGSQIQRRSAPATQTGASGDSVFGTEDDSIFLSSGLLTSALLERTLPMLAFVPEVMVETVKGSASWCCRGEAELEHL